MIWDLIIIGAGPAGMNAALVAHAHGLRVLVLDRQEEPGGQIFRRAGSHEPAQAAALGPDYAKGRELALAFGQKDIPFHGGATVWHIAPSRVCVSRGGVSEVLRARRIIMASGAMERPVPIPGWTLPGVMTAGAADVLLKAGSLVPDGPVVISGNGPLIMQTAAHMRHFKVPVAGIALTTPPGNIFPGHGGLRASLRRLPGALLRPGYLLHGMGLSAGMALRNRCFPAAHSRKVEQRNGALSLTFTSLGKQRSFDASLVLLHEGIIPETRLTRLARCRHGWDPFRRYWRVEADMWGATTVSGLRAAGDCAGVLGAEAATVAGRLAALDVARELGVLTLAERDEAAAADIGARRRYAAFQHFIDGMFAQPESGLIPSDDAVVCRCENLTAGELRREISAGNFSPDGLKTQARPGMGRCQGRMCGPAVAELIAHTLGIPLERLEPCHAQLPLFPVPLQELANMNIPPEGL